MRKSKIYNFSDEEFIKIIKESTCMTDCCRKLGFTIYGGNGRYQIKKRCEELGISTDHFKVSPSSHKTPPKYNLDDILIENSPYQNRASLKKRLIAENRLEYKCAICGNTGEWNNQTLVLQLDHINGINNDNRIENLRFLCPNCHSQTKTFSGKNIKTTSS